MSADHSPSEPTTILWMGRFGAPFGVRGWVKVFSFTTPMENLLEYHPWHLGPVSRSTQPLPKSPAPETPTLQPTSGQLHGKSLIVKLPGIETRDQAAELTHRLIGISRATLTPLPEGEYYWADLIGLNVITNTGLALGVVDSLFETGANDVLVVKNAEGFEYLLPYIDSVVRSIDLKTQRMIVDWEIDTTDKQIA